MNKNTNLVDFKRNYIKFASIWLILTLIIVIVAVFWQEFQNYSEAGIYILLWLTLGVTVFVAIKKYSNSVKFMGHIDIFEIPIYISITSIFLITFFGIFPYFNNNYLTRIIFLDELPKGLLLTGVGLISLWIGYILFSNIFHRTNYQIKFPAWLDFQSPSIFLYLFTYLIIYVIRFLLILQGGGESYIPTLDFGFWSQWLNYAVELRWFLIALVITQVIIGKWPRKILIFIIFTEIFITILSGWSSVFLKISLLILGCSFYYRKKANYWVFALIGLIFLFFIPITRTNREFASTSRNINQIVEKKVEDSLGDGLIGAVEFASDLLVTRQSLIAQTPSVILRLTPNVISYRDIDEILLAPLSIIPRVLWQTKPNTSEVFMIITTEYLDLPEESGSSAPTISGNLFMYGGWGVVIIGMFILGVVAAIIYKFLALPVITSNYYTLVALYAGLIIATFNIGEGDYISIWQGLIQRSLVFLVVAVMLCMKKTQN